MFYLSRIEHTLGVPPKVLHLPIVEAIKGELEKIFLDKVITNLGLCISVYDIRSIDGGFIVYNNGAATYTVVFTLVMFRPFVGEVIPATVKEADPKGLKLSLGFFDDIYIPEHLLPFPSKFRPIADSDEKRWVWDYEGQQCDIDIGDEIYFEVHSVEYPSIPIEQPTENKAGSDEQPIENPESRVEKAKEKNLKPFAPMVIKGTLDKEGLGPLIWWEADDPQGGEDEEDEA